MTRSANADARGTDHHRRNAPFFLPNRFLGATNSQPYAHCVASRPYGHWCATTSLWPVPLAVAAVTASSHGPAICQAAGENLLLRLAVLRSAGLATSSSLTP